MNSMVWNSQEEVVWSFILAPVTVLIHGYAIYLCYAIYDYQDEKPNEEKSPIDILIKDLKHVEFWFLYLSLLTKFISLFTPPINSTLVYCVSHVILFLLSFYSVSWLVTLYIQYVYIFQHDQFVNVNKSSMRQKSFCWKIFLTIISLLLDIALPSGATPVTYQMLSKGMPYHR